VTIFEANSERLFLFVFIFLAFFFKLVSGLEISGSGRYIDASKDHFFTRRRDSSAFGATCIWGLNGWHAIGEKTRLGMMGECR
jgi:hypothetical protein